MNIHIQQLTSLRFLLAFWVVLHHYSARSFSEDVVFISFGYIAVDFFFVLSGFVIANSYLLKSNFNYLFFLKKRLSKIYPLHIVFLFLYIALFYFADYFLGGVKDLNKYNFDSVLSNLLLLHSWGFENGLYFNFPSWSISAEWFAYAFIFVFFVKMFSLGLAWVLFFSIVILFSTNLIVYFFLERELTRLTFDFSILRVSSGFSVGCLFGFLFNMSRVKSNLFIYLICFVSLMTIGFLLTNLAYFHFLVIPIIGVFIYALSCLENGLLFNIMNNRLFVLLGASSYSLYMMHMFFYSIYFNGLDYIYNTRNWPEVFWYLGVICVVVLSVFIYKYVERPLTRIFERIII